MGNRYLKIITVLMITSVLLLACARQSKRNPRDPSRRVVLSHILVSYSGAAQAPETQTRTRAEARQQIDRVLEELRAGSLKVEDAVKTVSDDTKTKDRNGYTGIIRQGYSFKQLEDAVLPLKEGELSEVLDLPDGFHVFHAEKFDYRGYSHILLSYVDADNQPLGVNREKEEAETLAADFRKRVLEGEDMRAIAWQFSDGMEKKRGGYLPAYCEWQLIPELKSAWQLEIGEVSEVLVSPYGYHLFQRIEPLPEIIGLKHIMVSYAGAVMSPISVTRSREEAMILADEAFQEIKAGMSFEEAAASYSNDKATKKIGGDLGLIAWDEVPLEVESVAFKLKPGDIFGVVESPGGFHILLRYK